MHTLEPLTRLLCGGIYQIECISSGRIYIGRTIHFGRRLNWHKRELNEKIHHNIFLQRAWNKHGEENFRFSILEIVPLNEDIIKREQKWLDKLRPFDFEKTFNISEEANGFISEQSSLKNIQNWQNLVYREKMLEQLRQANLSYKRKLKNDEKFRQNVYKTLKKASKTFTPKRREADRIRGKKLGNLVAVRIEENPLIRETYAENMRRVRTNLTFAELSKAGKKRAKITNKILAGFSKEKRSEIARKGWETRRKSKE
jgi:group I intron endonuclease